MPKEYDFYTELDPSLRVRVSGKGDTVVFRRGHLRTADPHVILTLQAHPDVTGPPDVEVELREPAVVPVEDEVITEVPEIRQCGATTAKGPCKIPAQKGRQYCHVHLQMMAKEEEEV